MWNIIFHVTTGRRQKSSESHILKIMVSWNQNAFHWENLTQTMSRKSVKLRTNRKIIITCWVHCNYYLYTQTTHCNYYLNPPTPHYVISNIYTHQHHITLYLISIPTNTILRHIYYLNPLTPHYVISIIYTHQHHITLYLLSIPTNTTLRYI